MLRHFQLHGSQPVMCRSKVVSVVHQICQHVPCISQAQQVAHVSSIETVPNVWTLERLRLAILPLVWSTQCCPISHLLLGCLIWLAVEVSGVHPAGPRDRRTRGRRKLQSYGGGGSTGNNGDTGQESSAAVQCQYSSIGERSMRQLDETRTGSQCMQHESRPPGQGCRSLVRKRGLSKVIIHVGRLCKLQASLVATVGIMNF